MKRTYNLDIDIPLLKRQEKALIDLQTAADNASVEDYLEGVIQLISEIILQAEK